MSDEIDFVEAFAEEEEKIKSRFLEEVDRIIGGPGQAGRPAHDGSNKQASNYRKYAHLLKVQPSFISAVKSGRYKANIRTLWITKKYFPDFDVDYVLWGTRSQLRPIA